jgi:hypothetical protein
MYQYANISFHYASLVVTDLTQIDAKAKQL